MTRNPWLALGALLLCTFMAGDAQAQYGYGRYGGWGGWGGGATVGGDLSRGAGVYAAGLGRYNLNTAQARSINANTAMQWNQYMFQSQMEANRRERARLDAIMRRDSQSSAAIAQQVRDNPTERDIERGDALNAAVDQISDPRVHRSALRLATGPVKGKVVATIPFVHASDALTISLNDLTVADGWPIALRDDRFAAARSEYQTAIALALREDEKGDITLPTIQRARDAVAALQVKLKEFPPADNIPRVEAENYLKTLAGMTRMLQKPDIGRVIAELDANKDTTLGDLLAFMHVFSLRFGVAETPEQKLAYQKIYPMIDELRDRIVSDLNLQAQAPPRPKAPPPALFQDLNLNHQEPKPNP